MVKSYDPETDPHNRFWRGVPPKSKGDWAFISHMIETAYEGSGKEGVVVPHGVLFRGSSEGKIRKKTVEENLLEAVIGLPANLFFGTGIPAAILVFNKGKGNNRKVLFIDASRVKYTRLPSEDEKRVFDYAIFQNFGYRGLYGGLDAKGIHSRKGLKKSRQILDHMGSTELAANLFRATQAEDKLRREKIRGKFKANQTHFEVGRKVRKTIEDLGGTMPENLPSVDSIKKVGGKSKGTLPNREGEA